MNLYRSWFDLFFMNRFTHNQSDLC